jgi:sigma-B regulation protein RsbU (phosphoserine phosphatase)
MSTHLELVKLEGPTLARSRWRIGAVFRIGRADGSDLELPDPAISRRHSSIEKDGDGWCLRDSGSRLGTFLNELPIENGVSAALRAGDVIRVGAWRFRAVAIAADVEESSDRDMPTLVSQIRAIGSLAEQRLELLLKYAGDVAQASDESVLAEVLAEHALLGSGYARATVLWHDADELVVRCQRPAIAPEALNDWRFSRSLIKAAQQGELACIDVDEDQVPTRATTIVSVRRALCAPLMLDGRPQAYLYLDSDRSGSRRYADAPSFCHALARLAALALANLRRLTSERERVALEADLGRAREVQARLLPNDTGALSEVDYALRLHPGRVVAGDIVDVFELEDGRVVAMLGDVSGAGLGAGLVMASVQSFLRAGFAHETDPARVVARLNAHLCAHTAAGRFVTLWVGVFELDGTRCRFVDAGHGHALRIKSGQATPVPVHGAIPLGIDSCAAFVAEELVLRPGEMLFLYSDGVLEQRDDLGSALGHERLIAALESAKVPSDAVEAVWQALSEHAASGPPDDDATVLALAPQVGIASHRWD